MFDLAAQSLAASGCRGARRRSCLARLDGLAEAIGQDLPGPPADAKARAKALFLWLWRSKPQRYQPGGPARLDQVLDAQLASGPGPVGNCLGLTLLYNALAPRLGLRARAIYLPEAFGRGPHVLSLLDLGEATLDVENILPHGFDYPGHRVSPGRETWGDRELVADLYVRVGNEAFEEGDPEEALRCYRMARRLNPQYLPAQANWAIALAALRPSGAPG